MSALKPHVTVIEPDEGRQILIHPASDASVKEVLKQSPDDPDGRSNWVWVRFPNGDLVLGIFPQGDTYFAVEDDAHYTGPWEDTLWCEQCGERPQIVHTNEAGLCHHCAARIIDNELS